VLEVAGVQGDEASQEARVTSECEAWFIRWLARPPLSVRVVLARPPLSVGCSSCNRWLARPPLSCQFVKPRRQDVDVSTKMSRGLLVVPPPTRKFWFVDTSKCWATLPRRARPMLRG